MPQRKHIVVTGAAGRVGRVLVGGLRETYDLAGLDRHRAHNLTDHRVSITRVRQNRLVRLLTGADALIHLAADPSLTASWRSVLWTNVLGTRNLLEAAHRAGVPRVVFASSNAVTSGYERDEPWASVVAGRYDGLDSATFPRIRPDMPVRPANPYGVSKVFGEAACRYYSDRYGMSTICVRIGTVTPDGRPTNARSYATLLTHADLVRLATACIEAPDDVKFAVLYGVSANTWRLYDLAGADIVGYVPQDDAETWRPAAP